jgi:hypothetical protein
MDGHVEDLDENDYDAPIARTGRRKTNCVKIFACNVRRPSEAEGTRTTRGAVVVAGKASALACSELRTSPYPFWPRYDQQRKHTYIST